MVSDRIFGVDQSYVRTSIHPYQIVVIVYVSTRLDRVVIWEKLPGSVESLDKLQSFQVIDKEIKFPTFLDKDMLFEDFEPNRIKALDKFRWRILILCTGRSRVYGITNEVDFTTRLTKVQLRNIFFSSYFYLDDLRIFAKISLFLLLFNFLFLLLNFLDYFLSLSFVNWNTNDCHSVFSFRAGKNSVTRY